MHNRDIQALKDAETASSPSANFLLAKVFSETCLNAIGRSRVYAFATKAEALDEAINLIGDYDLSTTEFYKEEFGYVEGSDPTMDVAIASLAKYHRITLGDFMIEIDDLQDRAIDASAHEHDLKVAAAEEQEAQRLDDEETSI